MRKVLAWIMLLSCPLSSLASDVAGSAMLSATGQVTVNGTLVNGSIAVFPGSVIETNPDSVANLILQGSTLMVQPDTLVRFDGNEIYLDHGGLTLGSSTALRVHVKCVTATPMSSIWTQYDVVDVSETVQVVDRKARVKVESGAPFDLLTASSTKGSAQPGRTVANLREGEQYNRHESEACPDADKRKIPSAGAPSILTSPYAIYGGIGAVGGILVWILHHPATPMSSQDP